MDKLLTVWKLIRRYKYVITVAIFIVIVGFADENSLVRRMKYSQEINELNREIEKYQAEYDESTKRLNELVANPEAIEQIAREKYRMKKPNEDIFVFENK